jgi:putative ABC transport system permease protein
MIAIALGSAGKNVARHRRRTAICMAAVSFGVVALLMAQGFIGWVLWAHRETTIKSHLAHIQVSRAGYHEEGTADPFRFFLDDGDAVRMAVSGLPHVTALASRVEFSGLISRGDTTTSFIGEGIEPQRENLITSSLNIVAGENLAEGDLKGILLGEGLAANLGVKISDTVVLLGKTASGSVSAVECEVRGLFRTITKAYDDSAVRVPIQTARRLLRTQGSHLWVVLLEKTEQTPSTVAKIQAMPGVAGRLDVVPWYGLADFYLKTATLLSRQVLVTQFIIAVIVGLSILNSLTMSVMERTGDIGTSLATGATRSEILIQFIAEGGMVGLLGALLGVAISYPLAYLISAIGIPMPPPPGQSWGYLGEIRLEVSMVIQTITLVVVTSLLASVSPACRAARLNIVDALRKNR